MIKSSVCLCVMSLLGIKPIASVPCIIRSSRCLAINNSETICVSFFNGTGLDWFQAKSKCEADGGRLAHLGNYSAENGLITTASREGASHVRVGVMTSVRGDDLTFMTNTSDLKCTNTISQQCSSTTSPSECAALGCCFHGCICQYPENQFVASVDLNFTRLPSPIVTERSCVKLNSNHTWSPFNCSEPGGIETVYACERSALAHNIDGNVDSAFLNNICQLFCLIFQMLISFRQMCLFQ
ncbi:uncharacterized protein LOC127874434 isoform X3 [Dreissena polymorpha]|uniref:uncharacterized protein LOC127874434 isoform X3 n=1 Tax=Dreissena polymorpha TaxID=45954 RepID=UPI00226482DE|nr:uncharacterized protein LOC127874434 isoform X3 [Dreissena polymorpha]